MVILVRRWAEMHMAAHPEVQIQVTGGGSGTGLAALQNGTTDIAASSRPIERAEIANFIVAHGAKPREVAVAMDGIAVYVHRDNTVPGLNFAQLTGIFAGETRDWSELGQPAGPIVAYTRENSSGTYAFFKEHVMGKRDFGTTAQAMAGTAALIHAVAKDVRGIGYGGIGYHSGVRAVPVAAYADGPFVMPSMEAVLTGRYPISRKLFFYVNPGSLRGEVERFLGWVTGEEGQALVAEVGYYPLPGTGAHLAERIGGAPGVTPAPNGNDAFSTPAASGPVPQAPTGGMAGLSFSASDGLTLAPPAPASGAEIGLSSGPAPPFRLRPTIPAEAAP